jgi:hypothetical protein
VIYSTLINSNNAWIFCWAWVTIWAFYTVALMAQRAEDASDYEVLFFRFSVGLFALGGLLRRLVEFNGDWLLLAAVPLMWTISATALRVRSVIIREAKGYDYSDDIIPYDPESFPPELEGRVQATEQPADECRDRGLLSRITGLGCGPGPGNWGVFPTRLSTRSKKKPSQPDGRERL